MWYTMDMVVRESLSAGNKFFTADTMRGFNTKLYEVYQGSKSGPVYFVYSDKDNGKHRVYKVRQFNPETGRVMVPTLHKGHSLNEARDKAERFAKGEENHAETYG